MVHVFSRPGPRDPDACGVIYILIFYLYDVSKSCSSYMPSTLPSLPPPPLFARLGRIARSVIFLSPKIKTRRRTSRRENSGMGKECDHPGCPKRAHYGVDGTRRAEFCAQHAHDGYVNVLGPRCAHPACSKRPTFGLPGKKVSRYIRWMVDMLLLLSTVHVRACPSETL